MRYINLVLVCFGFAAIGLTGFAQESADMSDAELSAFIERLEKEKKEIEALLGDDANAVKSQAEASKKETKVVNEVKEEPILKAKAEKEPTPQVVIPADDDSKVVIPDAEPDAIPEIDKKETAAAEKKPFWGYKSNKPLPYLLLVANNRIPKTIFADYLLEEYGIPHILLPANGPVPVADDPLFFIGKGEEDQAVIRITARQLSVFIAFLRPKKVIILGDTKYIHPAYRMAIPEYIETIEYASSSWKVNAVSIDNMMGSHKMFDYYYAYLKKKDAEERAAAKAAAEK